MDGRGTGLRDVVFVAVGTGIGVGIVADGRPVEGAHGIAGAAGWMVVGGAWKPDIAGAAVGKPKPRDRRWRAAPEWQPPKPWRPRRAPATAKALEALERRRITWPLGIAGLISLLDPEMVVLGGGLMEAAT